MGYTVKLINGEGSESLYACASLTKTEVTEDSPAAKAVGRDSSIEDERGPLAEPGIRIDLSPSGTRLQLPRDGHTAYVVNEAGKTVDIYRWPPQQRR